MPAFGEHLKRYYPGLTPREERVWRRWLVDHESEFDSFLYNTHVGEGVRVTPADMIQADAVALAQAEAYRKATQLKIDAIGLRGNEWWIIEVEDRATTTTLGQLLVYGQLLPKAVAGIGPTELAVVCRFIGADMSEAFEEQGVVVFVVDVPAFPTR